MVHYFLVTGNRNIYFNLPVRTIGGTSGVTIGGTSEGSNLPMREPVGKPVRELVRFEQWGTSGGISEG